MVFAEDCVPARKGDLFLLCTDGLLEATNKAGAEFGIEGMKAVMSSIHHGPLHVAAESILAAAKAFGHTDDDQTLLLVRC